MVLPSHCEAAVRVCPRGEYDIARRAEFAQQMYHAVVSARGRLLVVDLEGVTFLDASAVGILQKTRQVAREIGVDFVIANPNDTVCRVMDVLGALPRLVTPSFHAPN